MEEQKKNDSGITLVALVVSIIVMLILAGVSLNATIGENGIVTRAQEAALQHRIATELENLNLELAKINVDTISTDEIMAIQDIASYLIGQGVIDGFVTTSAGQIAAGIDTTTGDKYFFGKKGDNTYRITRTTDGLLSAELTTQTSGGDITGGYALITEESFNNDTSLPEEEKGKFTITDDAEVVFMDTITGALSIYVKSGVHATVGVYANMSLTNQGISRSAIDIESGGTLDLYLDDGVEIFVNSGLGEDGEVGNSNGAKGGPGGFAGIHVPEGAFLNLYGEGTILAYGGNAGKGTDSAERYGGGGGGGAGAGIGGNGGKGGNGSSTEVSNRYIEILQNGKDPSNPNDNTNGGFDGENGENCGYVKIDNNVKVYAYGGAGASAGNGVASSGGGGGGYPAAGIGGGGAGGGGGNHYDGAGGYSGAGSQYNNQQGDNGFGGGTGKWTNNRSCCGGGYYTKGVGRTYFYDFGLVGGMAGGHCYQSFHLNPVGSGGKGGAGGNITYKNSTNIFAYNGDAITNGDYTSDYYDYNKEGFCFYELISGNKIYNDWTYDEENNEWFYYRQIITIVDGNQSISEEKVTQNSSAIKVDKLMPITSNGKTFIPAKIFAQTGLIRETYTTNKGIFQLSKVKTGTALPAIAVDYDDVIKVLATEESTTSVTGYNNGYMLNQGIGSGAGYLESSNGTFEPIE